MGIHAASSVCARAYARARVYDPSSLIGQWIRVYTKLPGKGCVHALETARANCTETCTCSSTCRTLFVSTGCLEDTVECQRSQTSSHTSRFSLLKCFSAVSSCSDCNVLHVRPAFRLFVKGICFRLPQAHGSHGMGKRRSECAAFVRQFDWDCDGCLDFSEFVRAVCGETEAVAASQRRVGAAHAISLVCRLLESEVELHASLEAERRALCSMLGGRREAATDEAYAFLCGCDDPEEVRGSDANLCWWWWERKRDGRGEELLAKGGERRRWELVFRVHRRARVSARCCVRACVHTGADAQLHTCARARALEQACVGGGERACACEPWIGGCRAGACARARVRVA
eukprot:6182225-Pleurochrysis_carterae.AAC.1